MSWELFKQNILKYSNNPESIKDIDQVAKFYAREYDLAIKRGYDSMNLVTMKRGNVKAMEKLFKIALRGGLNSTSPYDLVGKMGPGVITYWTGGILNELPIPLIPSPGSIANVSVVSNTVTNPGVWLSEPSTAALLARTPVDNNTFQGAVKVVSQTGPEILNDVDDGDPGSQIIELQEEFGGVGEGVNNISPFYEKLEIPLTAIDTPIGDVISYNGPVKPVNCITGFDYDDNLSPNFRVRDLTIGCVFSHRLKPQAGFDIDGIICNLKFLAVNILEPLKKKYPSIRINSAFRGTPSIEGRISQHEKGEAVDIQIPDISSPTQYLVVANWIKANLPFDQMIFEHGRSIWLHISCSRTKTTQRGSLLTMINNRYEPGLKCYYT